MSKDNLVISEHEVDIPEWAPSKLWVTSIVSRQVSEVSDLSWNDASLVGRTEITMGAPLMRAIAQTLSFAQTISDITAQRINM